MSTLVLPPFNPLQFANRLKAAGMPPDQAEAQAEVMHEAFVQQAQVVSDLESQLKSLATDAKRDAEQMATKGDIALVRKDMEAMESRLVIKLALIMTGLISFAGAVLVVVNKLTG